MVKQFYISVCVGTGGSDRHNKKKERGTRTSISLEKIENLNSFLYFISEC